MKHITYSCHQPNFLPWIGYFHKIFNSDVFVILDELQYPKNSVANRNKIKTNQGEQYLSVPITKKVNDKSFFSYQDAIFAQIGWQKKIIKSIDQNYKNSNYYDLYIDPISSILNTDNFCEMNIEFIRFVLKEFEFETEVFLLSEIKDISGSKNDLLINIGNHFKAATYLSGNGARSYNDEDKFGENDIEIKYQKFEHPEYTQLYPPFIPYLSVIDLLFNEGKKGKSFIKKQA